MPRTAARPQVFGPFDGDFDPFEEEEDIGLVITFGRVADGAEATA
jgi:hypothetical protein